MTKIGLVVEGGGRKNAYRAGVLDGFIDERIDFDYAVGVSAGGANMVSFLAHQRSRAARFYTTHIKEPHYFGFKSLLETGNLFGLQYIYGTLTNSDGGDPLDFEALMENPTDFHVVATDAATGLPVYFPKSQMRKDDYREIMASCAIPVVSRPVKIGEHRYFDGGISDAIPVVKALEEGCDKIVVLSSKTRDYVKKPQKFRLLYRTTCFRYPEVVRAIRQRHIMYEIEQSYMYTLEKQGRAFLFNPSRNLKMGTYAMDVEANRALYELGYSDFLEQKKALAEFLSENE